MKPQAVTEAASAAADDVQTQFLPTDKNYRMTGELPDDEADTEDDPASSDEQDQEDGASESAAAEGESAETGTTEGEEGEEEGSGESAAASQAATTQEKDKKGKTAQTSESRWAKLSRENRELRERLARVEGRQEGREEGRSAEARDGQQGSQAAGDKGERKDKVPPKPKIDDVDEKTGEPKYATYADYDAAKDEWLREDAIRRFREESATTERQRQQQQVEQVIAQDWTKRVEKAAEKYPDFQEVALDDDLPIKQGSPVDLFILDSAAGTDILYHLGSNPEELDRINKLHPLAQVRELTKLELKLTDKAAPPAKKVTQAPRPPHQTAGTGTVTKDAVQKATEEGDFDSYMREQNARDLARRKKAK